MSLGWAWMVACTLIIGLAVYETYFGE
jgi:hypothetical protein